MEIEDLNLEFEDEVEAPSTEAIDVDVELEFAASEGTGEFKNPVSKSNVVNLEQKTKPKVTVKKVSVPVKTDGDELSLSDDVKPIASNGNNSAIMADLKKLEQKVLALIEAKKDYLTEKDIEIAVLKAKQDYLVNAVSEAKVMDQQVTKYLQSIHKKAPAVKQEVQLIKKVMTQFIKKISA